jgi:hypothetical protein
MGFDDEIDQLKMELRTPKLDLATRKKTTSDLCLKLRDKLKTRRLEFSLEEEDEPTLVMTHTETDEQLGTVVVNSDGSLTFQSALEDDNMYDDTGYFPSPEYFDNEQQFLEDIADLLKPGIAEYELDQEED